MDPTRLSVPQRYHSCVSTFSILSNQAPLDHERFSSHRELEAQLKATLRGEVHFDIAFRAMYAADSSNYRQLPIGVILPRDATDVDAALSACRATGAAVLPRGAGTSLAGQCANVAVVFDFSKYMNHLGTIDPQRSSPSCSRASFSIGCARQPNCITSRTRQIQPRTRDAPWAA